MNRMANKIIFLAAISDAFKDEEDRELNAVGKIDIPEDGNATPILTDLFYAFKIFYTQISGDNVDSIEFIGVLTRLVFQDQLNDNSEAEHGHWVYNQNGHDWGLGAWECSLCHSVNNNLPIDKRFSPYVYAGSKYCPNCGAKMDGGENNGT